MEPFDPQDRLVDALLSELAGDQPSPGLRERTLAEAFPHPDAASRKAGRPYGWRVAGMVIAALAAGLLVAASLYLARPRLPVPSPRVPPPVLPPAPAPAVQLASGCQVEPVDDAKYCVIGPRHVLLDRGQLYVEIDRAKAEAEPFVVATPAGEARAVGTRFVVETRSEQTERSLPPQSPPTSGDVKMMAQPTSGDVKMMAQPTSGDVKMMTNLSPVKFLTQVLVLAGIVQLVNTNAQMEGHAGEVLKTESAQPQPPQSGAIPLVGNAGPGMVVLQAGEQVQLQSSSFRFGGQGTGAGTWFGMGQGQGVQYKLPGYWQLQNELVRKEIELVPEQEAKLQQIAKNYQEKLQKSDSPGMWTKKDVTNEERMKLYKEYTEKSQELQKSVEKQVKEVLLPFQLDALQKINLRSAAAAYLQSPVMLDRLGVNEEQKQKLLKNRADLAKKVHDLQVDSFEEVLKILSKEQIEKLK